MNEGKKHHSDPHNRIIEQLDAVLTELKALNAKEKTVAETLQDVKDALAKVVADVGNVQNLIAGLSQQIADLQAQIAAGTGVTVDDLQGLADSLNQVDAALDAVAPDAPAA